MIDVGNRSKIGQKIGSGLTKTVSAFGLAGFVREPSIHFLKCYGPDTHFFSLEKPEFVALEYIRPLIY